MAELGDGWYGFNLGGLEHVADRVAALRERSAAAGRRFEELTVAVSVAGCSRQADADELERLGVTELVLVEGAAGATRRGRAMGGWPGPRLAD